jgi:hypothetical protein
VAVVGVVLLVLLVGVVVSTVVAAMVLASTMGVLRSIATHRSGGSGNGSGVARRPSQKNIVWIERKARAC